MQAQKEGAQDPFGKTFASLMIAYADGSTTNMEETLQKIPVKLSSVKDYAIQVNA